MEDRVKIPKKIESTLMFQNDHTCCICREKGKDVQIHHIINRNNNNPSNLAVLCLDCHSRVTGSRGLGKKFTEQEIKHYKKDWEFRVKRKRGLILEPYKVIKKNELNLLHFEIKKNIFEYSITKNLQRAKEILDLLGMYYIFEQSAGYIMEQMHFVVPLVFSEKKSILMAESIPNFFVHLPSPELSKVTKSDIKTLDTAIDLLEWLGEFEVEFGKSPVVVKATAKSLFFLFRIVQEYNLKKQRQKIISSLKTMRKASKESEMTKSNLNTSVKIIDHVLNKITKF